MNIFDNPIFAIILISVLLIIGYLLIRKYIWVLFILYGQSIFVRLSLQTITMLDIFNIFSELFDIILSNPITYFDSLLYINPFIALLELLLFYSFIFGIALYRTKKIMKKHWIIKTTIIFFLSGFIFYMIGGFLPNISLFLITIWIDYYKFIILIIIIIIITIIIYYIKKWYKQKHPFTFRSSKSPYKLRI
jgi:hypothetical protein